nr:EOG090X0A0V [Chydorus sphaericus]
MARVVDKSTHSSIVEQIQKLPYRNRVQVVKTIFPQICVETLKCIAAQECQKKMRFTHARLTSSEAVENMYERYIKAVTNGEEPGVLLRLSDEVGLTPALLARTIVERHYQKADRSKPAKMLISNFLKNTSLIDDRDLAFETYLCLLEDDDYGPIADASKQSIGNEYEIRLRMELEEKKITFLHEDHLRARGYDKTPDIKLEIPIAVDGQVINWIESKALFGDEDAHRGYLKDQLYSYWNRFGPGLVIYWFGYVKDLEKIHQNRTILIRDSLPSNIILMEQDPHCSS